MKKLSLRMDELAVETFATGAPEAVDAGTVHGLGGCTGKNTCQCPSSIYRCGTIAATFSCITKIDCA
jgi:hypothetical protein